VLAHIDREGAPTRIAPCEVIGPLTTQSARPLLFHLPLAVAAALLVTAGLAGLASVRVYLKPAPQVTPEQAAFFESKVRPVLAANCFVCHGEKEQRGRIRLDTRANMVAALKGGPVVMPGSPETSRLIQAVRQTGAVKMPPNGKLRDTDIAALAEWVKMGAPWPEERGAVKTSDFVIRPEQRNFWSFQPVRRPAQPAVTNKTWARNPIDRFILAALEAKGLKPAPVADRRTLIRRATYDLIGLPPSPAEVDAFLADRSQNAWEKVVGRLLASPHYGERWGRRWLDLVRYADSNGLDENVAFAHAYLYRDYVVNALNADKPYNEFLTEQLAGDILPTSDEALRAERLTATGFLTLGAKVLAEPDKDKMLMDIVDEQIEVTSKAFLGLTVACARCHNHKFDPISTKDYYALAGIFKSTKAMQTLNTVAMWNERPLESKEIETQRKEYQPKIAEARQALDLVKTRARDDVVAAFGKDAVKYVRAGRELAESGEPLSLAEAPESPSIAKRTFVEAEKFSRGNVGIDTDHWGKGIGIIYNIGTPDAAEWDVAVPSAGTYQVELRYASAEERPVKLSLNGKVIRESTCGTNTGSFFPDGQRWEVQGIFPFQAGSNTIRIDCASVIPHFDKLLVTAVNPAPDKPIRTAEQIAGAGGLDVEWLKTAARIMKGHANPATLTAPELAKELEALTAGFRKALDQKPEPFYVKEQKDAVAAAEAKLKVVEANEPKLPMVMAVEDGRIADCKVHVRGDTTNLGDLVPRRFLTVLCGEDQTPIDSSHSGRLELARWLASPSHPLTGRVAVNRIWQDHFGEGLVRTPDNWGFLGLKPTHPELLDWLTSTFVEPIARTVSTRPSSSVIGFGCGWSFKRLHKLIMMSSTYKMASVASPAMTSKAETADPENRLLWRFNRRRLEAEPFRDAMLSVSGKIDLTMGGSLLKTENHGYVTNDQSGNAAQYNSPRRSLYLPMIRNALFDMFQAFDVGDPSMVNARRNATTVAPQALYVMNSPFVLEQSRSFAEGLLNRKDVTDPQRIDLAYRMAMARPATTAEIQRLTRFIQAYESRLVGTEPEAAKRHLEAWSAACQALFASNEFIYVN
jgi:cytochrome c553